MVLEATDFADFTDEMGGDGNSFGRKMGGGAAGPSMNARSSMEGEVLEACCYGSAGVALAWRIVDVCVLLLHQANEANEEFCLPLVRGLPRRKTLIKVRRPAFIIP